ISPFWWRSWGRGQDMVMPPHTAPVHSRKPRHRESGELWSVVGAVVHRLMLAVDRANHPGDRTGIDDQIERADGMRPVGEGRVYRRQHKGKGAVQVVEDWLHDALTDLHFSSGRGLSYCQRRADESEQHSSKYRFHRGPPCELEAGSTTGRRGPLNSE